MKDIICELYDTVKEYGASRANGKDMESVDVFKNKCVEETCNYTSGVIGLRDVIYTVGDILEEDLENKSYKGIIPLGNPNLKAALFVARVEQDTVHFCTYAKEGLINQHMAKKAADMLKNALK